MTIPLLLLLLSLPAALAADWPDLSTPPAASAKEGSKDAALVIGIEAYRDLDPVLGARANAEDWYRWLVKTRGVPLARVHRLVDDEAQDHKIRSELKMAAAEVQPGGTLWVVFIGHGAPTRDLKDGVLIGVDAAGTEDGLYQRSVPRSELLSLINAGRQQQAVVLLDACFTGQSQEGRALVPGLQASGLVPTSARVQSKVTLLTATSEGEFARRLPGTSRPAFSYLALGGLRGWADENGDGQVTASELALYATGALRATVRGGTQTPQLTGEDRVLAFAKERGPDLVELAVATPSAPASVTAARIDLGGGSTDFGVLAAQAQAAEAAKRQAEAAAAAATAALAQEERKQLDAAAAKVRTQASADFAKLGPLLSAPSEAGKPMLEAYVAKYGAAKVTVGSRTEGVEVPEVARVQAVLRTSTSTPTGKAGERVVTTSGIAMRVIPAGSFPMGCTKGAGECEEDEKPPHTVTLSRSYLLGETEVTQGQWKAVMGSNPSHFSACGLDCPVEKVSWLDAVTFANALSKKEGLESCYTVAGESVTWPKGLSCTGYRLPTEAEWEYAARAGREIAYAGGTEVGAVAWYEDNSGGKTHPVGEMRPNGWGLHDMSGNVWEWTWDWYGAYPRAAVNDPTGAATGSIRVYRGGSWRITPQYARLVGRVGVPPGSYHSSLGLRLARSVP